MRLPVLFAAATLLLTTLAAHADTLTENISINNVVANQDVTNEYGANTNLFPQFDPSLGTLNSISLSLNGTATNPLVASDENSDGEDSFMVVDLASAPHDSLGFDTQGSSDGGSFSFSASGQQASPFYLALFEGTGTLALRLDFIGPTTVNSASGTLTYNYTPTAVPPPAVTPEPSSIMLLGTGLLGLAGMVRRRLA